MADEKRTQQPVTELKNKERKAINARLPHLI